MELKEKLKPAAEKLKPLQEKLKPFLKKAEATGLRGYAIRTAVINLLCLVAAVVVCHWLLSMGLTVLAICAAVVAGGLIVHANLMFAMDMK